MITMIIITKSSVNFQKKVSTSFFFFFLFHLFFSLEYQAFFESYVSLYRFVISLLLFLLLLFRMVFMELVLLLSRRKTAAAGFPGRLLHYGLVFTVLQYPRMFLVPQFNSSATFR